MAQEQNQSTTASMVNAAAQGAGSTVDAAHRAAAGVVVGMLQQAKDVIGVGGFAVDLAEVTVQDLIDRLSEFAQTGKRPQ